MEKIPTADNYLKRYIGKAIIGYGDISHLMIEFAKLHVEAMMKEMEQKLLDTLDDLQYLEENVCGVIEEIREYKSDNIK